MTGVYSKLTGRIKRFHMLKYVVHVVINVLQPFNAGIKSLRATLPDEIFDWGFCF
jgi:hypothetical protein